MFLNINFFVLKIMKNKIFLLIILFLASLNFSAAWAKEEQAYVLYVIDGDTIGVSIDGKEERVRLIGIDAPEIVNEKENKKAECFADEATEKLKELILNKNVKLVNDNISDDKDKYNRLLRYIYLDDLDVSAELVKTGHAKAFLFFNFDKLEKYKKLAEQAELENIGLYDLKNCEKNFLEINNNIYYLIFLFFIFLIIILKIIRKFR